MSKPGKYLPLTPEEEEEYGHDIIYAASFKRNADTYMYYIGFATFLCGIPCILFYGIGLLLMIYTPVFMYIAYQDIITRKLFVTSDSVIYITSPPCCLPCFGVNKTEKHVLLSLVTDVIVEQSWYASCWGLEGVRIENAGQGAGQGKPGDLSFTGIEHAKLFKKIVLRAAASKRAGQSLSRDDIDSIISGEAAALRPLQDSGPVAGIYGTNSTISSANVSSPETNEKLDQLNETMKRIEQLLTLQVRNSGPSYSSVPNDEPSINIAKD
mmetsp:Transcript_24841/g.42418  ORF Transcript_24841/g.42418 Transcript_24841/m.42418 type:complete len:268 (-) Transcript_24841:74-877(-)